MFKIVKNVANGHTLNKQRTHTDVFPPVASFLHRGVHIALCLLHFLQVSRVPLSSLGMSNHGY